MLSPRLESLQDLPFSTTELIHEAGERMSKMSIQGVQPKLSARLDVVQGRFILADIGGDFILKPQNVLYPQLPENEALTMRMAQILGIDVPLHGLVYAKDGQFCYFIKRFDRLSGKKKRHVEDFSQLLAHNRETKYQSSMERVAMAVEQFCTFPLVEKRKLFQLVLFCYLTGNEDMHLKNFSLLHDTNKVVFSPAYDLLNTTIALKNPIEELALPLKGKKRRFKAEDFKVYFGQERLGLNEVVIGDILNAIQRVIPTWQAMIRTSFLSPTLQDAYLEILEKRCNTLAL
jgi:serine/threonine-protein kinase HipA